MPVVGSQSEYPRLVDKFNKIDLAPLGPWGLISSYDNQAVLKQEIDLHVISDIVQREWRHASFQMNVVRPFTQARVGGNRHFADAQDGSRIGL